MNATTRQTCPACQWEYTTGTGHYYKWDVMGDPRTIVEICETCHHAAERAEAAQ